MNCIIKKALAGVLTVIILLSMAPLSGFKDLKLPELFGVEAAAASIDDLFFISIENGKAYEVSACNKNATGDLIIPSEYNGKPVKSIGFQAFFECSELTGITIGNGITSIGEYAFTYCTGLTSVTIPDSVTDISSGAFSGCETLINITIPNSVTSINEETFRDCVGLTSITIPNSVKSIGYEAFGGCSGLTSITIPNSVTSIDGWAFNGCSGLMSVTISNSVACLNEYVFSGCTGLTSITIPKSITAIGRSAFNGCSHLANLTIPNSVTSIDDSAFFGCAGLTSIVIPSSVTHIGSLVFYDCIELKNITIPYSVTYIGDSAFYGCHDDFTIYCYANSEAQRYAISEMINYVILASHTHTPGAAATCTAAQTCTGCGQTINPALGHNYSTEWTVDKAATTTEAGSKSHHCTRCDEKKDITVIPKLDAALSLKTGTDFTTDDAGYMQGQVKTITAAEIKGKIANSSASVTVTDKNGKALADNAPVGTGAKINLLDGTGKIIDTLTVVISGDANGDGAVTTDDARDILRAAVGIADLSGAYAKAAKVTTEKAEITTDDARKILRRAVGLE